MKFGRWLQALFLICAITGFFPLMAAAALPVVKTVPWVASNPLIPHDTYAGKQITLKGTCDLQGANIEYSWDFGDGSTNATGTVTNKYAVEALHSYTGTPGTIFTARLTITDTSTNESASTPYYIKLENQELPVEVNIAIDEGLWYLHKNQIRNVSNGVDIGYWNSTTSRVGSGYYASSAANVNAFEVNGHLASGGSTNPYTETVSRGLNRLFEYLYAPAVTSAKLTYNPTTTVNPDSNGNGLGVAVNQSNPFYQGGVFIDAIIASGTPNAVTLLGPTNVVGRLYKDIVQDMVDYYAAAQYYYNNLGGWRYSFNQAPDNSVNQWAAIGMIPAERVWGLTVPGWVKTANINWLKYSQSTTGHFGYTNTSYIWGPYATTASGMVQMALDGIGRGGSDASQPSWDLTETYIRDRFCTTSAGATNNMKDNYYGLFSFTKAMQLHDSNGDKVAEPLTLLQSTNSGVLPIDWYAAEASNGAPCDGVARTLVNDQSSAGYWFGHYYTSETGYLETAQAIIMLNRTIFEAGAPVAVAMATPNPAVLGQSISLDGSGSFHQDTAKSIDSWEWDLNNDGVFDFSGPVVTTSFAALGSYPVTLRVTDNGSPEASAETTIMLVVSIPPLAPTANAGGPYTLCENRKPWFLDGTGSVNPDEGQHSGIAPGDTIQSYLWDLSGNAQFNDASGATPDVTAYFTTAGNGSYLVQLKVTDTSATSFPALGQNDLSDTDSAQVQVKPADDPACAACVSNLAARPKLTKVQLTWTDSGADHYNVYRSNVSGGPYLKIGTTTSTYSTYLDSTSVTGNTYYYVVREADLSGVEICQSNEASASLTTRVRR